MLHYLNLFDHTVTQEVFNLVDKMSVLYSFRHSVMSHSCRYFWGFKIPFNTSL